MHHKGTESTKDRMEEKQSSMTGGSPTPALTAVGVDGATNAPGSDADGEVALDIDVAGSVAPGAKVVV
jgi:subtilase family serine protease